VAHLRTLAEQLGGTLEFVEANLDDDRGWAEAVAGCTYVQHVASPNPPATPKHEDELIRPAVDGTMRVLRACADNGSVRRVVLTSSIVAITMGPDRDSELVHTEADWSDPDLCPRTRRARPWPSARPGSSSSRCQASIRSSLSVVNPGFVLGPLQHAEVGLSVEAIRKLLDREVPGSPRIGFATVDVRDVAILHRLAMERPEAAGNRYLCAGDHMWLQDLAKILAEEFNPRGFKVPTGRLPYWLMWAIGRFDKTTRMALDFVGRRELVTADKAVRELGWSMRPARESIIDTGRSLLEYSMLRRSAPA